MELLILQEHMSEAEIGALKNQLKERMKENRSQSKKIRNTVILARTTKLAIMHLKKTTLHTTTIHIAPAFRCLKVTCTEHK